MLKLVYSMNDLDIGQLLQIYEDWNLDETEYLDYLRNVFFQQRDSFFALWIVDGQYKAALRIEPYNDGLLIASLCTASSERRKGYGYLLVTELIKHLSTLPYKVVYSHIEKRNTPSVELHLKCGFQFYRDYAKYLDGTVTHNSCTMYILLNK